MALDDDLHKIIEQLQNTVSDYKHTNQVLQAQLANSDALIKWYHSEVIRNQENINVLTDNLKKAGEFYNQVAIWVHSKRVHESEPANNLDEILKRFSFLGKQVR